MLHRLLQLCLVAIATMLVVGDALACPHHTAAPQQISAGASDASTEREAEAGQEISTVTSATLSPHEMAATKALTPSRPRDGSWVASALVSDVAKPADRHNCCGTSGCTHAGVCAGACCTSAQMILGAGGPPQERKIAFCPPRRPAMATAALATRPLPTDGDRDRRRWRDAEAMRSLLREPRLAQVVRLTI